MIGSVIGVYKNDLSNNDLLRSAASILRSIVDFKLQLCVGLLEKVNLFYFMKSLLFSSRLFVGKFVKVHVMLRLKCT